MEFKMIEESYEVSYPTEKKNNGTMVKFITGCKSIGICFLFFELLKNQCLAADIPIGAFGGLVAEVPPTEEKFSDLILLILCGTIMVSAIIIFIVIFMKRNRKSKANRGENNVEDINSLE